MNKIKEKHLEGKAYVYVRQSSLAQIQRNQESTKRQYRLFERALRLGWPKDQVEIIDEDQGQSGASSENRHGFNHLVSEVVLGKVGVILGLEASRLARSCSDWYRLLEVASISGTLIMDEEGVYDPNHYNDRLLLGLKGTLSEAELHFIKQRMIGGRRTKAGRGEFRIRLPVGYVWEEEKIWKDPDEQVQNIVGLFFKCFDRIGSARGTIRYFDDQQLLFPARDGWGSLNIPVSWRRINPSRAVEILRNPIYAGIYTYDRNNPAEENPEDLLSGGRIWLPHSHPSYVTEEAYYKNLNRLDENRKIAFHMLKKGTEQKGSSLLQGIVLCGVCGRKMKVEYKNKDGSPNYQCWNSNNIPKFCQHINGRHVDRLVEEIFLSTITPAEINLALGALEKLKERSFELMKQWTNRIEAAQYEAEKAARRYYRVEPENRLVARTLESDWNLKLEELARLEKEYEKLRTKPPFTINMDQWEQIRNLAQDIPRLWNAETTPNSHRKKLLRVLIEDVTLQNQDNPYRIKVSIRWKTEKISLHHAKRVVPYPHRTKSDVVEKIKQLYIEHTDKEICEILNKEGYRSGYGKRYNVGMVAHLRHRNRLMKYDGKIKTI